MVSLETKWVLTHTNIDPKKVALVLEENEQECWEFAVELELALYELEASYYANRDEHRLNLQAFIDEIPNKQEIKRKALLEKLYLAKRENRLEDVKLLLAEVKAFLEPSTVLTPEIVARAKSASIRTLLKAHPVGNISCPFHEDRTPSFQITKKNTFACHSCGAFGDVIDLYRRIHSCDFKTAVNALQ